eukprot:SAG31_NODE_265_length_18823_cov_5.968863_7_plen_343_part_00
MSSRLTTSHVDRGRCSGRRPRSLYLNTVMGPELTRPTGSTTRTLREQTIRETQKQLEKHTTLPVRLQSEKEGRRQTETEITLVSSASSGSSGQLTESHPDGNEIMMETITSTLVTQSRDSEIQRINNYCRTQRQLNIESKSQNDCSRQSESQSQIFRTQKQADLDTYANNDRPIPGMQIHFDTSAKLERLRGARRNQIKMWPIIFHLIALIYVHIISLWPLNEFEEENTSTWTNAIDCSSIGMCLTTDACPCYNGWGHDICGNEPELDKLHEAQQRGMKFSADWIAATDDENEARISLEGRFDDDTSEPRATRRCVLKSKPASESTRTFVFVLGSVRPFGHS